MRLMIFTLLALLSIWVSPGLAIDEGEYKPNDLDQLLAIPKIKSGVKLVVPKKFHFRAILAAPVQNCNADILKRTLVMQGSNKEAVEKMAISKCQVLRSAKGGTLGVFVEDKVGERLVQETKPGMVVNIYATFPYISPSGPALLVNDFKKLN
jgi:hypothetical protein